VSGDAKLEVVTAVPDRAMVIFAHPDDAEIGSGGVVAKWVAQGCEVTYVLTAASRTRASSWGTSCEPSGATDPTPSSSTTRTA
jgi:hypothetical protein